MNEYESNQFIQRIITTLPREIVEHIISYLEVENEEELYTCERCGRVWDGYAQCFPCNHFD